jgi:2',3'-cyclic-nucleotide 2'-phosphodiesterase (5'-nucleotidase family)
VQPGTTVTFRIVNFGGTSAGGTWYIFDVANSTAADFQVDGVVSVATAAVNGVCGTANGQALSAAPTANLCSVGTASAVTGTGPWNWSCAGANGGTTASCSANLSTASPFTIFHTNDVHARLTPHKWVVSQHGTGADVFEDVGGAAHLAGKMLSLTAAKPNALVLDGGDISEGNPVGDMNCTGPGGTQCSNNSYGNGGMTAFYELLHSKLKGVAGRNNRGMDALVVGNHDVRDISYINNMEHMAGTGVPVISANVRDLNCTAAHPRFPTCEHFPPYTTVTVNGTKIGIIGYTTSTATVGASLASTLTVVDCQWTGSATCNIAPYVNKLRNVEGADVVILLTHDGHSDLVDPTTPVIADTADAKVPEIVVSGHWHTWTDSVWQPAQLNYKTLFVESSSYMKYIGEVNVSGTGQYVSAAQHVLRNSEITPDPDVLAYVNNLKTQFQASAGFSVDQVVGYTNDNLLLDNRMKWWSADEYPWSGNNTAGQWITDAMKWKCDNIAWPSGGGCDLAIEAGGGVRSDIPAGAVTYLHVYETFPWADDTYVRISMTGQDIINFIKATNLDTGFSRALDVTAFDGIPTSVKMNGAPIGLSTVYKVAINNYMLAHPPGGYAWPATINAEADPGNGLVRTSLIEFMQQNHSTPAVAYSIGGDRYHFNGEYSGGYRAVVTMMNDNDTKPTFDNAYIRFLSALPETLARRGGKQVPTNLVNADGTINAANRLSEQQLYRSFLGFKTGALKPGDIIETWGKASFFGGNPEFVDQEGVYGDGVEFKIVGHDDNLAKPAVMSSIGAFWNDNYKNHYVQFLAKKASTNTVTDQFGQTIKIWDVTGFTAATLPGNVGDTLQISGVPTMESFALRFRRDSAVVSAATLPTPTTVSSSVDAINTNPVSAPVTLSATASSSGTFYVAPNADSQVASGNPTTNSGTATSMFVQSSSVSSFGNERAWLKFDLNSLPAGPTVTGATLQLWNFSAAGAAMPAEVRGGSSDTWTETGITFNTQPAFGSPLDTVTFASGATNLWYSWNVGSFVQQKLAGNKLVSLVVKPVNEGSPDAIAPAYRFDAKEFGSNAPVLQLQMQTPVASVQFFYRYSTDNAIWGAWTSAATPDTTAPYTNAFAFPNGPGYYEFYSIATDSLGNVESAPTAAQASVRFLAPVLQAQTITFTPLNPLQTGATQPLSATASSGLVVTFSSQTAAVCSVSGTVVTAIMAGTCTIAADQAGNAGFSAAPTATQSFTVTAPSNLGQTINFAPIPGKQLGAPAFIVTATATSGLAVSIASQTPAICSISSGSVTLLAVGTCILNANQPGDAVYAAAATVSQSFAITGSTTAVPIPQWALLLLAAGLLGAGLVGSKRRLPLG